MCVIIRYSNLILNLFSLMVDANIPDIALEPDKTVKKVCLPAFGPVDQFLFNSVECFLRQGWIADFLLISLALSGAG